MPIQRLRRLLMPYLTSALVSDARRDVVRRHAEKRRAVAARPHLVRAFVQADDPHSALLVRALPALARRAGVVVVVVPVPPPPAWAAPERERLQSWARTDAAFLARRHGLGLAFSPLEPTAIERATALLVSMAGEARDERLGDIDAVLTALHAGDAVRLAAIARRHRPAPAQAVTDTLARGDALRAELGHYLGGMLQYEGEWYWGIDRLHYLETRLDALGATGLAPGPSLPPPDIRLPGLPARSLRAGPAPLEFFLSFRSPYSWLAMDRTVALASHYGVPLKLRFVLPMVMRGLPVPPRKSRYIVLDCKREASRLGLPFGRICDPVGHPVERALALIPFAVAQGRGPAYVRAVLSGIFARGIDVGRDAGLAQLVAEAGLDWTEARAGLTRDDWRTEAEANRNELLTAGLWGVPSFRIGGNVAWGQDRLWLVEEWIAGAACATGEGTVP
ncbi:2-hydroxychromene-2-carboxylate isomerase [Oleisolibacter albus]|uniref:2-hydroxychromene-2-carboxylate isomerase n=1 Tax=Oleisolibacter albus TaxID=2171757 RepID=UPI000DF2C4C7|nr:DsbA family protein [Oleisolibacter albus]